MSLDSPSDTAMTALYRVALGPVNTARYLPIFARFDATGRTTTSWNWAACLCTLNWMVFRQLWSAALVYVAIAEGLALLVFGVGRPFLNWPQGVEWGVLGAFAVLAFAVPGLYGNAILHADIRKRIARALAASRTVPEACTLLDQQASSRKRLNALVLANLALAAAAVLAYLVLPQNGLTPRTWETAVTVADAASAAGSQASASAAPSASSASASASAPAPTAAAVTVAASGPRAMASTRDERAATGEPAASTPPVPRAAPSLRALPAPQVATTLPAAAAASKSSPTRPATPAASAAPTASAAQASSAKAPAETPASAASALASTAPASSAEASRATARTSTPRAAPAEAASSAAASIATPAAVGSTAGYYINVGLFADEANARKAQARLLNEGLPAFRQELNNASGRRIRVRVGPYDSRATADAAAAAIRAMALDAVVFRQER